MNLADVVNDLLVFTHNNSFFVCRCVWQQTLHFIDIIKLFINLFNFRYGSPLFMLYAFKLLSNRKVLTFLNAVNDLGIQYSVI